MSKELAQTVGGKRVAWLLAILAAFAVVVTVAGNWRSADAIVTGTDFCLDEEVGFLDCVNDVGFGPYTYGDTVSFDVNILPLTQATLGDLQFVVTLDADLGNISNIQNTLGQNTSCVVSSANGGTGNVLTCTIEGPVPLGASGKINFDAEVVGTGDVQAANNSIVVDDLGEGGQPMVNGVNQIDDTVVLSSALSLVKSFTGNVVSGGNITMEVDVTCVDTADDLACANVVVTDVLDADFAAIQSVSATQGSCSGLDPFPDTTLPDTVVCNLGTIAEAATATITIVATLPTDDGLSAGQSISFSNQASATQDTGPSAVSNNLNIGSIGVALPTLAPGLYHVDPFGNLIVEAQDDELGYDYIAVRDDQNNVIGYQHNVCLVPFDELVGSGLPTFADAYTVTPVLPSVQGIPFGWRIENVIGGGQSTVNGQFTYNAVFDGYANGAGVEGEGLPCVSWYSTAPGEQNVTIIRYDGEIVADWADGYLNTVDTIYFDAFVDGILVQDYSPLVKEWNVLEPTAISERGADVDSADDEDNIDGDTLTSNMTLNAALGEYQGETVELDEHVFGSHESVGGTVGPILVDGAKVTFTVSGTCGMVTVDPNGDTTVESGPFFATAGSPVTVTSAGVPIEFDVDTYGCTSANNSSTTVTVTTDYPNLIGSVQPAGDTEVITVDWVSASIAKQVFLAWAGQRVVIEHNWGPNGFCDTEEDSFLPVTYIKGSGPGNFLPGFGAVVNGSDQVSTIFAEDCVTQALFESEDPGQVDIEAFVDASAFEEPIGFADSKIAFVIYYMKIETIDVSLVTSVEKPSHNATGHDFAPGNPWDASADATSAESNVSADLLVRARVKGWFTNSNPSGRERDASNPLNVLPADRWVMPDDWALLQGGGGGIDFRPEYDYMISPEGEAFDCDTPTGPCDDIDSGSPPADGEVWEVGFPVAGPYSLLDYFGDATDAPSVLLDDDDNVLNYNYLLRDGVLDWWDAPMPPALVTFDIRGAGFIKEVMKEDVYYTGTPDGDYDDQDFPNPVYATHIPSHDIINDAAGGGYEWDTWGTDGPYVFWNAVLVGENRSGNAGETLTAAQKAELDAIADVYGDDSISRRLAVYSDNHGEAMVIANGDFNLDYDGCQTNTFGGGYECEQDDVVGSSNISAVADYPDFYGKHFPVVSNTATVDWTWGGYKETRVYPGETDQFVYVVFHALDRDGFCKVLPDEDTVSLHPVYSDLDDDYTMPGNDPVESVDFAIDSDEGGIFTNTSSGTGAISVTREFADGIPTYSTADDDRDEDATDHHRSFPALDADAADECQAWVKVSNSLLGITNILVLAHDDEGDIGFDEIVDFDTTVTYTLNFRWSLITWMGADGISPSHALSGEGDNAGGTDILDEVTAVYGWEAESQEWLAFFPDGVDIPGANDLTGLENGAAYWIAIKGPESIQWEVVTSVN